MMMENEFLAATTNELAAGTMKEVQYNETKILLANVDGNYYAVGAVCPHYKAPLSKGALCGNKLYCPWHHSVFNITNGSLLEPPALDGLPRYSTRIENGQIIIKLSEQKPKEIVTATGQPDKRLFVIIGGGAAGMMAAETLRSKGFCGRIVIITKESSLPYDRTALSKKYMAGKENPDDLPLRKEDFYKLHNIEVEKEKEVAKVDANNTTILFSDGASLQCDKLLVAAGSEPEKLNVQDADVSNIFYLRSLDDAKKILEKTKDSKKVCIIGASFIGMETAAALITSGCEVTVIAKENLPFEKIFGEDIGQLFYDLHIEKGVVIKTKAEVAAIEGKNKAEVVVLKSGERIETDMIITGIGVHLKTDFLQGIRLNETDKSVMVDEYLQAVPNLFAAGDIARFPDGKTGESIRIEHWRVAQQQGRLAALNMLGEHHSINEIVPFFWTNQFEKRLSYIGHAKDWDCIEFDGDIAEQKFMAFYIKDEKVLAVASMNRDVDSNKTEDLMLNNGLLTVEEIKQKLDQ